MPEFMSLTYDLARIMGLFLAYSDFRFYRLFLSPYAFKAGNIGHEPLYRLCPTAFSSASLATLEPLFCPLSARFSCAMGNLSAIDCRRKKRRKRAIRVVPHSIRSKIEDRLITNHYKFWLFGKMILDWRVGNEILGQSIDFIDA